MASPLAVQHTTGGVICDAVTCGRSLTAAGWRGYNAPHHFSHAWETVRLMRGDWRGTQIQKGPGSWGSTRLREGAAPRRDHGYDKNHLLEYLTVLLTV